MIGGQPVYKTWVSRSSMFNPYRTAIKGMPVKICNSNLAEILQVKQSYGVICPNYTQLPSRQSSPVRPPLSLERLRRRQRHLFLPKHNNIDHGRLCVRHSITFRFMTRSPSPVSCFMFVHYAGERGGLGKHWFVTMNYVRVFETGRVDSLKFML